MRNKIHLITDMIIKEMIEEKEMDTMVDIKVAKEIIDHNILTVVNSPIVNMSFHILEYS